MSIELKQALNRVKSSRRNFKQADGNNPEEVKRLFGIYHDNMQAYKAMQRQEAQRAKEQ